MRITRLLNCINAAMFMILGLIGLYLGLMQVMVWVDPSFTYPLQATAEEIGIWYPIVLILIGLIALAVFLSFVRQARGTVNRNNPPLMIDRITTAALDNW